MFLFTSLLLLVRFLLPNFVLWFFELLLMLGAISRHVPHLSCLETILTASRRARLVFMSPAAAARHHRRVFDPRWRSCTGEMRSVYGVLLVCEPEVRHADIQAGNGWSAETQRGDHSPTPTCVPVVLVCPYRRSSVIDDNHHADDDLSLPGGYTSPRY